MKNSVILARIRELSSELSNYGSAYSPAERKELQSELLSLRRALGYPKQYVFNKISWRVW